MSYMSIVILISLRLSIISFQFSWDSVCGLIEYYLIVTFNAGIINYKDPQYGRRFDGLQGVFLRSALCLLMCLVLQSNLVC